MNQRDILIEKYALDLKTKFSIEPDMELLRKVTIACGPAIYNRDSATVSSSDESELERIKANFLIKKLQLSTTEDFDTPIQYIMATYGKTHRTKYRVVVYYLLAKHFGKEDRYY